MKISKNNKQDIKKFKRLVEDRNICIKQGSSQPISTQYSSELVAKQLFPLSFRVRVREILLENDMTKTFVMERMDKKEDFLPYFQPGQYVTFEVSIEDGVYRRPYSISCSPSSLKKGVFQVTVQKVTNGIVSNYFFQEVKVGDVLNVEGPYGTFGYQRLRDSNDVIAIVDGSGIAPILSMAESIVEGLFSYHLKILYEANLEQDLIFRDRLQELSKHKRIEVFYFLDQEEKEGFHSGRITKDFLETISPFNTSYFICGSNSLYERMNTILKEMQVPNKYVRHDAYMSSERNDKKEIYQLTILMKDDKKVISCCSNETLMQAMEKAGIKSFGQCGVGVCGFCQSKLIEGEVLTNFDYMKKALVDYHYIHPCVTYPASDVTIVLPF